mmetsp:Transcript_3603/g.6480  ORF Transcript_3603/g.6480 Transcript_3603/m.6480 type:complete len:184 (-) Transcript_3603:31-582(-)
MPNLQGFAVYTMPGTTLEVNLTDGLSAKDRRAWSDVISYKIKEKPLHGKIKDFSNAFGTLTYTPKEGYMGTDFFTFKVQLGSLSSNLATVAIIVDDDLTRASKITEQRKLGVGVLHHLRKSLTPATATDASSQMHSKTTNPMNEKASDDKDERPSVGMEMGSMGNRGRDSLTKTHQVNESVKL